MKAKIPFKFSRAHRNQRKSTQRNKLSSRSRCCDLSHKNLLASCLIECDECTVKFKCLRVQEANNDETDEKGRKEVN